MTDATNRPYYFKDGDSWFNFGQTFHHGVDEVWDGIMDTLLCNALKEFENKKEKCAECEQLHKEKKYSDALLKDNSKLSDQVERYVSQVVTLKGEKAKLEAEVEFNNNKQILILEAKLKDRNKEIESLESEIDLAGEVIQAKDKTIMDKNTRIDSLEMLVESYRIKTIEFDKALECKNTEIAKRVERCFYLDGRVAKKNKEIDQLQTIKKERIDRCFELTEERDEARTLTKDLLDTIERRNAEIIEKAELNLALANSVDKKNKGIEDLKSQIRVLKDRSLREST